MWRCFPMKTRRFLCVEPHCAKLCSLQPWFGPIGARRLRWLALRNEKAPIGNNQVAFFQIEIIRHVRRISNGDLFCAQFCAAKRFLSAQCLTKCPTDSKNVEGDLYTKLAFEHDEVLVIVANGTFGGIEPTAERHRARQRPNNHPATLQAVAQGIAVETVGFNGTKHSFVPGLCQEPFI